MNDAHAEGTGMGILKSPTIHTKQSKGKNTLALVILPLMNLTQIHCYSKLEGTPPPQKKTKQNKTKQKKQTKKKQKKTGLLAAIARVH